MRLRYYYCERFSTALEDFLKKEKIKYKISSATSFVIFNIWSDEIDAEHKLHMANEMAWFGPSSIIAEYTPLEYSNAKLLVMRPHKQQIDIRNGEEAFRYLCTWKNFCGETRVNHETQIGSVVIAREPSINTKTAFWCEDTGFAQIFTSKHFVDLASENQLTGIVFRDVLLRNGKRSENLFQMTSDNIIGRECVGTGYGEKVNKCPCCGAEQYFIGDAHQLHLDFSKIQMHSDFYQTAPIFGEGIPNPLYIITQRFYQVLKNAKMDKNVSFSPVVDISEK